MTLFTASTIVNFIANVLDLRCGNIVGFDFLAYFVPRVHHRRVVSAAKVLAYGHERYALTQNIAN